MHTRPRSTVLLTFVLATTVAGIGQLVAGQTPAPPSFRSATDVVRLEVSVLDRNRRPVQGLTASDFTVFEDGKPRPLVAFTPVDLPETAPEANRASWLREAPRDVVTNTGPQEGRLVVIAFDWSIRFYDQELARKIAHAAVDALGPGDRAAVIFTNPSGNAGRLQNFTADRALLRLAIDQPFATAQIESPIYPGNDNTKMIMAPEKRGSGDCLCGTCSFEALSRVATVLRPVTQQQKLVLFVTAYVQAFEAVGGNGTVAFEPGGIRLGLALQPGACSTRIRDARVQLDAAAADANVRVHVLDAVGLETPENAPLGSWRRINERHEGIPVIADLTGGRTVMNTGAPEAQVASILNETASYYVLGFDPSAAPSDRRLHRIEVKVARPDVDVFARERYSRVPDTPSNLTADDPELARVLGGVLPGTAIALEAGVVPMITDSASGASAVVVGRLPSGPSGDLTMVTAAFSPAGRAVVSNRVRLTPSRSGAPGPLNVVATLPLRPGPYEIRLATEVSADRSGSLALFVDVPDFARAPLSTSGVLLHAAPEEPTAPAEVAQAFPMVPTSRRHFRQTDAVTVMMQVGQGTSRTDPPQAVDVQLRIDDSSGRNVRTQTMAMTSEAFQQRRFAWVRVNLPMADLVPGDYLLRLSATAGEASSVQQLRFAVSSPESAR